MSSDPSNPSDPFPREAIPPELVEWARQTFDEEGFLAQVREIEATGRFPAGRLPPRGRSTGEVQESTAAFPPTAYRARPTNNREPGEGEKGSVAHPAFSPRGQRGLGAVENTASSDHYLGLKRFK